MTCIFYNALCKPLQNEKIRKIYDEDISKFMLIVCSMCIKNRYSRVKERISKKRYVVVNTL